VNRAWCAFLLTARLGKTDVAGALDLWAHGFAAGGMLCEQDRGC
jgi:hypothetical protein